MEQEPKPRGRNKGCQKTGGRKKGTPNKSTAERHQTINEILDFGLARVYEYLDEVLAKEKLAFILKLMSYSLPKMNQADYTDFEPKENLPVKIVKLNLGGKKN